MGSIDEAFLDDKLGELEKLHAWSPRVVSKLEGLLRGSDEWALFRINPFVFAEERNVSEDEAVDLFLMGSKVGLFQMTWSLLCPGCGAAVQSFSALQKLSSLFYCFMCGSDVETRLDEYVHVAFTVSPKARAIPAHDPSRLSVEDLYFKYYFTREARIDAGGPRFIDFARQFTKGIGYLEPHSVTPFDVELDTGAAALFDMKTNNLHIVVADARSAPATAPIRLKLQDGKIGRPPLEIAPGPVTLEIENDSDERNSLIVFFKPQEMLDQLQVEAAAGNHTGCHFEKFLSGRRLLTSHTFRRMFGTEIIRNSEGLGVRDISILFTDLKGSTALYDRMGDLKAFALVNQHFERLGRAITRYRGAVVKTIGDAVMASFETPCEAVQAARDMLHEIEAFNDEVGEREIVLKVGIHRGASIAVTLNDRVDFFGQTVNIAARVQGLADADEIYITEDVYREPQVKELLSELHVTPRAATLKGVQRTVSVFRVATGPESSQA